MTTAVHRGNVHPVVAGALTAGDVAHAQYLEDTCKTALNRVPDMSRVPFRWTVNPYRGCMHSCPGRN